jgi:CCR4-NOT transcription complex subunit 1
LRCASSPRLYDEPQFCAEVVDGSALRALDAALFEKVQRLVQKPAKSSVAKTLVVHPLLRRFDSLQPPPPRVCKAVQLIQKDPSTILQFLNLHEQYSDWLAMHIVRTLQEQPKLAPGSVAQINEAKRFWRPVFQAAQALAIVQSPKADTHEGAAALRLIVLRYVIGRLTVAVDRPLLSRFLDLKRLLIYAWAQGKLYAVVPFVAAIVAVASRNYGSANSYVASLLQVLAGSLKTNSIKLFIKHHL